MIGFVLFVLGFLIASFGSLGCAHNSPGCASNQFVYLGLFLMLGGVARALSRMIKGPKKIIKDFDYLYISVEEVSKRSNKSVESLIDEIQAGKLKGKEFQSGWFVSREELIRLKI